MSDSQIKTGEKVVQRSGKTDKTTKTDDIHIADVVNFYELYRVKGRKRLFTLRAAPSASGMCAMIEFMNFANTCVVHHNELESLGHLVFYTYAGHKDLTFKEVFRHLYDAGADKADFANKQIKEQMENAVPCFDEDQFKPQHMERCLVWFVEIIKKLNDGKINQK
tara:strand:+ start:483 stop:977 length:495 start_codon:yes stop_codon:yes gene_type:complete